MSENVGEGSSSSSGKQQLPISAQQLTADMMRNPAILMALQQQLNTIVGSSSGYVEGLPKSVQKRIQALKNLQMESSKIESKFYAEVHELERKYSELYHPLFNKRSEIVTGMYEPMEEECEGELFDAEEGDQERLQSADDRQEVNQEGQGEGADTSDPKGIPSFWLTIFKNVPQLQEMIQAYDEPVLEKLVDIKLRLSKPGEPMTFTLDFHFDSNDFFTNSILSKRYDLQVEPQEDTGINFEGPEIVSCSGCQIDWKEGKNVTVETASLKQGTITSSPRPSFFNFFSPPVDDEEDEDMAEESDLEEVLTRDFEIGHLLRDRIIPCAVLYFTGDIDKGEEEGDDEEEDEDIEVDEGSESSNSDNDPDFELDENSKDQAPGCNQQ